MIGLIYLTSYYAHSLHHGICPGSGSEIQKHNGDVPTCDSSTPSEGV